MGVGSPLDNLDSLEGSATWEFKFIETCLGSVLLLGNRTSGLIELATIESGVVLRKSVSFLHWSWRGSGLHLILIRINFFIPSGKSRRKLSLYQAPALAPVDILLVYNNDVVGNV